MANQITGIGVALRRGDGGGPETFTKIAQLTSITGPDPSQDIVDTTNMDVTDRHRTKIGGLINGGTITLEGIYDDADSGHTALRTDMENGTVRNFELAIPAPISKTYTIAALVASLSRSYPMDGLVTFSATFEISGKPTVA